MIRIVIENLLLFLAPTLLYFGYIWLTRDGAASQMGVMDDAPFVWLAAAGAALMLITLVLFENTKGGDPDQGYAPPTVKDGKLIPGHRQ